MKTTEIKKQIEKKEKEIVELKEQLKVQNLIEIPELNIKIRYEKWADTYEKLLKNIPKGFRLMRC